MLVIYFFFFFSSRRRHTRFDCDWSSDVCSSDLGARFIFQRLTDGEPFINERSEEILFHAEISGGSAIDGTIPNSDIPNRDASGRTASSIGFTINTRYKVKDMIVNGKLEY